MKNVASLAELKAVFTEGWGQYIARIFWENGTLNTHHARLSASNELSNSANTCADDVIARARRRYGNLWAVKFNGTTIAIVDAAAQHCLLIYAIQDDGSVYYFTNADEEPDLVMADPAVLALPG